MVNMGYPRKDIEDSISENKYNELTATYLLLGRRATDVSVWDFKQVLKLAKI